MKRLTQRIKTGEVLMAPEYEEKYTTEEWISVLQDRLAAYEDTGWSPQACAEAREAGKVLSSCDISFGRLAELLTADKDGRVVVLPCKVGDTVWVTAARVIGRWMPEQLSQPDAAVILRTYIDKDGKYLFETERYTFERGIIGKAVFLTREEAEQAMEGQKHD